MLKSFFSRLLCAGAGLLALVASSPGGLPPGLIDNSHASARAVAAVQKEVTNDWMRNPDVLGTAIGFDAKRDPALVVYVDQESENAADAIRALPSKKSGVNVKIELTDKFRAMAKPVRVNHQAKQTPPIQLGTSGGWREDSANGFCCGGTLGSLVLIGGQQHILSNYHVLEADIVPGGNGVVAKTGDNVVQPALIDINCTAANGQNVATLVKRSSLPASNVDCAVAKVIPGMVANDGAILQIGPLSSQTVGAALRQAVKKSGRTTGLTRSSVSGLNATVSIAYDNECAGGAAFTKTFTGQIVITNKGSKFLNSGDSGSLLVEDTATRPRAVGLLYAGSNSTAIANPINEVLSFLGATMVGSP